MTGITFTKHNKRVCSWRRWPDLQTTEAPSDLAPTTSTKVARRYTPPPRAQSSGLTANRRDLTSSRRRSPSKKSALALTPSRKSWIDLLEIQPYQGKSIKPGHSLAASRMERKRIREPSGTTLKWIKRRRRKRTKCLAQEDTWKVITPIFLDRLLLSISTLKTSDLWLEDSKKSRSVVHWDLDNICHKTHKS